MIVGRVALNDNGELRLADDTGTIRVIFKGNAPDGLSEVRGEFWDLGRMNADDPRLAAYDLRSTFQFDPEGPGRAPGQVMAIVASSMAAASPPLTPSIRAIVLYPSRYRDQHVTITGQFAGRNLLGDLPDAPANSRLRLRAALGRRGDLGHATSGREAGTSSSRSTRASTPVAGSK